METNEAILDYEALGDMTPAEREAAIAAYTAALTAPFVEELSAARYAAAKHRLSSDPALAGFAERLSEIEKLIGDTPMLQSLGDEERLRTAYYLDRGMQPSTEPSAEALVAAVQGNAEAMRLIEAAVVEKLRAVEMPPLAATAGTATAPLTPPKKPKSIDEASALARAAFGV